MNAVKEGYMCQTDWDWELGEALGGTKIYESIEDLKNNRKCVQSCGIVKVKIELVEIIDIGTGFKNETN